VSRDAARHTVRTSKDLGQFKHPLLDRRQPLAVDRQAILNSNIPTSWWPLQNSRFLMVLDTSICS
jgi:hypothetical protein